MFKTFLSRNVLALLLAAGFVFACSSCSEDEDFFEGTGTFTATIAGASYSADAQAFKLTDSGVQIIKVISINDDGRTFIMAVQTDTVGTFDIDLRGASVKYANEGGDVLTADRGTITLTKVNSTVSGTFDLVIDLSDTTFLTVSNGSFENVELVDEEDR